MSIIFSQFVYKFAILIDFCFRPADSYSFIHFSNNFSSNKMHTYNYIRIISGPVSCPTGSGNYKTGLRFKQHRPVKLHLCI